MVNAVQGSMLLYTFFCVESYDNGVPLGTLLMFSVLRFLCANKSHTKECGICYWKVFIIVSENIGEPILINLKLFKSVIYKVMLVMLREGISKITTHYV